MKTKIAAAFVAFAFVATTGFSAAAAADDASNAWTQSAATATPVQPRPETSGRFDILNDVTAETVPSLTLDTIRGAFIGGFYVRSAGQLAMQWNMHR